MDFDLRIQITYAQAPGGNTATVTCHGENHGTQPGVQYNKITTGSIGGTLPATALTGTVMASNVVSSSLTSVAQAAVTAHEDAIYHDALTNFVGGEH